MFPHRGDNVSDTHTCTLYLQWNFSQSGWFYVSWPFCWKCTCHFWNIFTLSILCADVDYSALCLKWHFTNLSTVQCMNFLHTHISIHDFFPSNFLYTKNILDNFREFKTTFFEGFQTYFKSMYFSLVVCQRKSMYLRYSIAIWRSGISHLEKILMRIHKPHRNIQKARSERGNVLLCFTIKKISVYEGSEYLRFITLKIVLLKW